MEVAERYKYGLGVKLVRGAYMVLERKVSDPLFSLMEMPNQRRHISSFLINTLLARFQLARRGIRIL